MKILLVDVLSGKSSIQRTIPLGLLKLSTFYKSSGCEVKLCTQLDVPKEFNPDVICFSCVFIYKIHLDIGAIRGFAKKFPKAKIRVGGVSPTMKYEFFRKHLGAGVEIFKGIDYEIEYLRPDWELIPLHTSYGFTSRGCNRKCPWCVVPVMEGKIKLIDGWQIQLGPQKVFKAYDNNILATSPEWMESVMAEMHRQNKKIDFNQAMDCRLFAKNKEYHKIFKTYESTFEIIRFSYDSNNLKNNVIKTNEVLREDLKINKLVMWYMLYGNGETIEDLWERIHTVFSYENQKIKPMRFKDLETGKYRCHGWCDAFASYLSITCGIVGLMTEYMYSKGLYGRNIEEFKRLIFMLGGNLPKIRSAFGSGFQFKSKHYAFIRGVAEGKIKNLKELEL